MKKETRKYKIETPAFMFIITETLDKGYMNGTIRIFDNRKKYASHDFGEGRVHYEVNDAYGGNIQDTFVVDEARKKGLGGMLVDLAEKRMCCRGAQKITGTSGSDAAPFWKTMGYTRDDSTHKILKELSGCPIVQTPDKVR
jgi:GNAT superfamily N-acetyltransferase